MLNKYVPEGLYMIADKLKELADEDVRTALTPLAAVKDVIDVATGNEAENTKNLIESIGKDIEDGFDKLTGEK